MKTVSYRVEVLGRLWMPMCHAATVRTISPDEYPWAAGAGPLNDVTVLDYPYGSDFGDFSSIEDFRVEKTVKVTRVLKDGRVRTDSKSSVIREWEKEENELIFGDCMYGEE